MSRQKRNGVHSRAWSIGMVAALTVMLGCWDLLNLSNQALAADSVPSSERGISVAPAPTNPKIFGRTLGEWSAEWWNWALQFPLETSPLFAEGDVDCGMEQSGTVWFLAGSSTGAPSVRNCTIPKGKALFFPVLNLVFWGPEDVPECEGCPIDSDPAACPPECEQALRELAFEFGDTTQDMSCTVDGVPCVFSHLVVRTQSPGFVLSLPEGAFLDQVREHARHSVGEGAERRCA